MSMIMAVGSNESRSNGRNASNAGTYTHILKLLQEVGVEDWTGRGMLNYAFRRVSFTDSDFDNHGLPENFSKLLINSSKLFIKDMGAREKFANSITGLTGNGGPKPNNKPQLWPVDATPKPIEKKDEAVKKETVAIPIGSEEDIVTARQAAKVFAEIIGFSKTEQIKIATVVSELARNICKYVGKGSITVEKILEPKKGIGIRATDSGRGISNLDEILSGSFKSKTGMGLGILCCKKLMDKFDIVTNPQTGTAVTVEKFVL